MVAGTRSRMPMEASVASKSPRNRLMPDIEWTENGSTHMYITATKNIILTKYPKSKE